MSTRWLLTSSAVFLAALGGALTFLPHELLTFVGDAPHTASVVVAQLAGALAMGWALTNWLSRGQRVGGIYARPLALGNFLHFFMIAMALLRLVVAGQGGVPVQVLAVPYVLLAVWWGATTFRSPV